MAVRAHEESESSQSETECLEEPEAGIIFAFCEEVLRRAAAERLGSVQPATVSISDLGTPEGGFLLCLTPFTAQATCHSRR